MIDINELRRLAQDQEWIGRWYDAGCETLMAERDGEHEEVAHPMPIGLVPYLVAVQPAAISELLDRLEAAESEAIEQARLNGMGAERELALLSKLEAAEKERDAMRAKIECMERQEPVAWMSSRNGFICKENKNPDYNVPLYAHPVAQPAPNFADAYQGAMEEVAIWKKRALEAEDLNRKFITEINGPTHMGEPAQPAPSVPDDVVEQAVNRFLSWKLPKDFHPDGGMVFIPTKGRGYDSPHWPVGTNLLNAQQAREMLRYVLAAAPEAKP